jgi:hypothetical protein
MLALERKHRAPYQKFVDRNGSRFIRRVGHSSDRALLARE